MIENDETKAKKTKSNGSTNLKQESNSQEEAKKLTVDDEGDDKMDDVPPSSPVDKDEIHGKNGIKRLSLKEEGKSVDSSEKIDKSSLYTVIALFAQTYVDSFAQEKITRQRNTAIVF